jgi:ABC-2 type transport system permease protein
MHYVVRALALVAVLVFGLWFFTDHDVVRYDATAERISSLSPKTKELIRNLDAEHPIVIDAFIGTNVPEAYVQTKFNLQSLLKEFDAMSGGKIDVRMHDNLNAFSKEASVARERFGIQPTMVSTRSRGTDKNEEVILGAAFTCGLEKVVVPFFDYGIPVEYELIRSIGTVAEGERKKIGLVRTDAQLYGGFSFAGGMPRQIPRQEIVGELEKQYEIEEVDPASPIAGEKYDVLVVVQPSSLGPNELPNVVEAIKAGVPTAVFEDPAPIFLANAPGTGQPKQAPGGGMFGGGQQPQPKGEIRTLWAALGIEVPGEMGMRGGFNPDVAWQQYNPYRKYEEFPDTFVFASSQAQGEGTPINPDDAITNGLNEVMFPAPGVIDAAPNSELEFIPLLKTGDVAGTIRYEQYQMNQSDPARMVAAQGNPKGEQILAAHIRGVSESTAEEGAEEDRKDKSEDASDDEDSVSRPINVVYVADIDLMSWQFLRIRARPDDTAEVDFRFENVNLHTTLALVEKEISEQRDAASRSRVEYEEKAKEEIEKIRDENRKLEKEMQDKLEALQKKQQDGDADFDPAKLMAVVQEIGIKKQRLQQKLDVKTEQLQRDRDDKIDEVRRQTAVKIQQIQNWYKTLAVIIPPIPPLLVGLVVFVSRRLREREGIAKSRLRL